MLINNTISWLLSISSAILKEFNATIKLQKIKFLLTKGQSKQASKSQTKSIIFKINCNNNLKEGRERAHDYMKSSTTGCWNWCNLIYCLQPFLSYFTFVMYVIRAPDISLLYSFFCCICTIQVYGSWSGSSNNTFPFDSIVTSNIIIIF